MEIKVKATKSIHGRRKIAEMMSVILEDNQTEVESDDETKKLDALESIIDMQKVIKVVK